MQSTLSTFGLTNWTERVESMTFLSSKNRSAEEFRFVSTLVRFTGLATRVLALPLTVLGFLNTAQAQTAPTLLPYTLNVIAGGATSSPAAGATCPVSGFKSTDAF